MDRFAASMAVLKSSFALLKSAYFASTAAFSSAVVFPSAMADCIEVRRAVVATSNLSLAVFKFSFAVPNKYLLEYSLVYVASVAALEPFTTLMYFSIALASASSMTPSLNAPSTYPFRSSTASDALSAAACAASAAACAATAASLAWSE